MTEPGAVEIPKITVLDQIANVASEEGEPITTNQVAAVLAAYNNVRTGDEPGTIRRDEETKATAVRVNDNGLHLWRVTEADGTQYNDLQPTLPWPKLS